VRIYFWVGMFFLGVLGLMGCSFGSAPTEFEVTTRKDGDLVTLASSEQATASDTAIFDIYSQIGIGDAVVKRSGGEWPGAILFRVYLTGLEEFKFAYGDNEVRLSVSSSDENSVLESMTINGEEQPISQENSFYMPIRIESENSELGIPLADGYFEIEAPADFWAGEYDEFAISWVDFYR